MADRVRDLAMARTPEAGTRDEDMETMRRVATGDEAAFRRLVVRLAPGMLRFATHLTGNTATAEDMVQQAFTQVWRAAPRWRPEARPATWIYGILRNECLQYLRKHKPGLRVAVELDEEALVDGKPLPEDVLEADVVRRRLDMAMRRLPERQRAALLLRFGEGLGQREVATIMGLGEKAVESLVSRGKAQLRALLADS